MPSPAAAGRGTEKGHDNEEGRDTEEGLLESLLERLTSSSFAGTHPDQMSRAAKILQHTDPTTGVDFVDCSHGLLGSQRGSCRYL